MLDVAQRIVRWIGYGGVGNLIQGEAFSGVADAARHHMTSAYIRNLYLLTGIKTRAVLDGVHKHFTEGATNRTSFRIWQFRDLIKEMEHPVRRLKIAASPQANPFRSCRDHIDSIIPAGFLDRMLNHNGEGIQGKWFGKIAKSMLAHRCDYVPRCAFSVQNDYAGMRTYASALAKQLDVFP